MAFDGTHQAGIATPQQDALHFAAFDVTAERVDDLRLLFREWTEAARRMSRGAPLAVGGPRVSDAPPDSGETMPDEDRIAIAFNIDHAKAR